MVKLMGGVSSGWVVALATAASLGLLALYPTPAEAVVVGCGYYFESVPSCPSQAEIDEICEDHAGGCVIREAICYATQPALIVCEYDDAPS